ncbi:MAG: EamA family transporter [Steroidobacteraceae bacterium]|jgi:drug/metabolite transporter (DMT)-like permease
MHQRPDLKAILLAFAGIYIIWGTTFLAIALAIRTIPPFFSGGVRFLAAGVLMYAYLRVRGQRRVFAGLSIGGTLLCGVLLSGIGNGFIIWGQQALPSGIAALFVGALPVLMLLFDWMFFSHRAPTRLAAIGLALGLSGLIVLSFNTHSLSGNVRPVHVIMVLLAEIAWSLGTLLQRRYVGPDRVQNFTCLQMLAGGAFQLLAGLVDREWIGFSPAQVSLQSMLAVLYLIVFGSLIAANCYSFLVAHVPAQQISTYALVNPVIALALGALVLGEKITPATALAAVLVALGVALVLWRRRPPGAPELAVSPRRLV